MLLGRGGADMLLGGGGPDELGRRRAVTGSTRAGDDIVRVRDGWRDVVRCGPGRGDIAIADRLDVLRDCERIGPTCSLAVWPRRA